MHDSHVRFGGRLGGSIPRNLLDRFGGMRERIEKGGHRPTKMAQTFWSLDADTHQPVCFTTATTARSVVKATPFGRGRLL